MWKNILKWFINLTAIFHDDEIKRNTSVFILKSLLIFLTNFKLKRGKIIKNTTYKIHKNKPKFLKPTEMIKMEKQQKFRIYTFLCVCVQNDHVI